MWNLSFKLNIPRASPTAATLDKPTPNQETKVLTTEMRSEAIDL